MAIHFDEKSKVFTLHTASTTYQMQVDRYGFLLHLYYGKRIDGEILDYLVLPVDRGFSGNAAGVDSRDYSLDTLPLEYPVFGVGDFRSTALRAENADGSPSVDIRYESHVLCPGKYSLPGLPALYEAQDGESETLEIVLRDMAGGLKVTLLYGVFAAKDIITRAVFLENEGTEPVQLTRVLSASLDLPYGKWDWIHLHGRHTMERLPERVPLTHNRQCIGSLRGTSSHHQNPLLVLCDADATEEAGDCYAMNLVYSGSFTGSAELDQADLARACLGLQDEGFTWRLDAGQSFTAPECVLAYSSEGIGRLSRTLHRAYRHNLCRGAFKYAPRPVVINNWEATYFDFNSEKLLDIARHGKDAGMDTLVMDDGWFGARNSDNSSLGDWWVDTQKLPGGLAPLVEKVNRLGLRFGIWVEPEMVSENSELYRAHPEWALAAPGRAPVRSRDQLVLDMSRNDVREYLYSALCKILDSANIEYVKWDMNRSLSDWYSACLPATRQGELAHRYTLGLYELLERLVTRYPQVFFEGCSGGGGRFDPGMLYYHPQIWTSDNTDAVERLKIQYGTSLAYPPSTMASHVSAVPNHQTGRITPLYTRGIVAMAGCLGYELDITRLSDEEKNEIRAQVGRYKQVEYIVHSGEYYRLSSITDTPFVAWMSVSENKSRALLSIVQTYTCANPPHMHVRLKGLDASRRYSVEGLAKPVLGAALMQAGLPLQALWGDYQARQLLLEEVQP